MRVHELPVVMPYRLDLTVSVVRRLSSNVVDLFTGAYVRALAGFAEPVIVHVTQVAHEHSLRVAIAGHRRNDAAVLALVGQVLGVDRNLRPFYRAAAHVPWLAPLVKRLRGVKPPRYPTLWEVCANGIVFQQLSLRAASTIMHRLMKSCDGMTTQFMLPSWMVDSKPKCPACVEYGISGRFHWSSFRNCIVSDRHLSGG